LSLVWTGLKSLLATRHAVYFNITG